MNECKLCKHYSRCSKDIYHANNERKYLIEWSGKDCWEMQTAEQILERQCAEFSFKDGKVKYFSISTQHDTANTIDDAIKSVLEADKKYNGKTQLAYLTEKMEKKKELKPYDLDGMSSEDIEEIIDRFNEIFHTSFWLTSEQTERNRGE